MKTGILFLLGLGLAGAFGLSITPAWAKDGVLSKVQASETNYCHLHFPAMREETLSWSSPVLKDAGTGDIIHMYGPCDYDPHGKEAVEVQKRDRQRRIQREYND